MQVPLEVSFRNVKKTPDLENIILEKTEKLEKVAGHITSCRVAVERPHKHMQTGNPHRVRIEINVPPGHKVVVTREPGEGEMHEELTTVLRNAFDSARRQLKDLAEQQKGETKEHPMQELQAVVDKLFMDEGYGFLRTVDDREIYFHKNSVLKDDFDRLEPGTGVRYTEEAGEKGPQATSVYIVDKPGSRISK